MTRETEIELSALVANYDAAERRAVTRLPNRAIQAFGAVVYSATSYPYRISHCEELWRYIDVMHEQRFEDNLRLLEKVTDEEISLASWLAEGTFTYSAANFSRRFSGRNSISRALLQLRGLRRLTHKLRDAQVLEVGPGSGYLSLLLAKTGHCVSTVEVSQAFALHQLLFFRHFLRVDSPFLAPKQGGESHLLAPQSGRIRQVPWWDYADTTRLPEKYDLIAANHALAEFHPNGLGYLLNRFGEVAKSSLGVTPFVVAESLGSRIRSHSDVLRQCNRSGWSFEQDSTAYTFVYDPPSAQRQESILDRQASYEYTLRRKIRRYLYLALREPRNSANPREFRKEEHASLLKLREVFDRLIPNEKTPDEMYIYRQ